MTARRFEVTPNDNDFHLKDNETGEEFKLTDEKVCYDYIVDRWNALHEENQKLKKENAELEKFRYSIFKRMGELYEKQ